VVVVVLIYNMGRWQDLALKIDVFKRETSPGRLQGHTAAREDGALRHSLFISPLF
jgi:hypothetical protein